ncbi:Uncharacterized protein GY17_00000946 [Cryptosporidium hominis]|uniref:Uncharacterized protein n=1 Tax=Cryptosporidium hominis TaxID=237895 RepID=A0ABX5BIE4_CRYHO|nr:hypothetical protein [Cryptosporidium hominis TU502]PPS98170.1 Uncharacterized protein GY17_00000946 [Cryptosporidium hominis]|eukprot:PPS98170.1 Uncharacterized protein GY17_00000946 [Cryptosporidium hominis]
MNSIISLLVLSAVVLANISIYPTLNTDTQSLNYYVFSYAQINSAVGSTSGSGQLPPNERKRKLSSDERDSSSSGHRPSRRLRLEDSETSCFNTLDFLKFSLEDISAFHKPEHLTEAQLMELVLTEFEKGGISREDVSSEQILAVVSSQAKICYKKWKTVKQSLKSLEASLTDLEEKQRNSPGTDEDEARAFSDAYSDIVSRQELLIELEASLASVYNNYLLIKEKHTKVRRSGRIASSRQHSSSYSSFSPQTPSTSSSLQSEFSQSQTRLPSAHTTSRYHSRTHQSGRGVTSTRGRSTRMRHRRRRRTLQ